MATEYWGWHFSYFLRGGTHEDMDYIDKAFEKAVEDRGLGFVGLDIHQAPNRQSGPLECLICRKLSRSEET